LEGLEASVVKFGQLERTARIDSEYFERRFRASSALVQRSRPRHVASLAGVSDGNHFTISEDFVDEGIPYFRGQDVVGQFFVENATPNYITEDAYNRPYMSRSHLKRGDVLLSIVGTIGELSLVGTDSPATCSCKLAILRPHSIAPELLAVFLRSKHGRNQIERLTRGAVQTGLILEDMDQLWVPEFSDALEEAIISQVNASNEREAHAKAQQKEAERLLLSALGLADWTPPEPLAYSAKSADVFASGRLDAQFYAPRIQQLVDLLSQSGSTVGAVAKPRRERFNNDLCETFDYIEIGDVEATGTVGSSHLQCAEAPSRATWHVHAADVITSTVRPIRRLSAQIGPEQEGYVCSSGFVVLTPTDVAPEVLLTFLRLPAICELMDLYTSASMYPAISETDILALPFPTIQTSTSNAICMAVQQSRETRQRARDLLNRAKHAVEIAIEDSEAAALRFLDEAGA
jgi:type I restriction enzyme, S subunit